MLTCDDVFELITADHPHQSTDLLEHLRTCPRCRDLAEAIEPLRHVWTRDGQALDGERPCQPVSESLRIAQSAASRLNQPAAPTSLATLERRRFWNFVTVFVAGAVAALFSVTVYHSLPAFSAPPRSSTVCLRDAGSSAKVSTEQLVVTCVACHLAAR
jgi:hypothetical protein